jgi:excisionase family DNA binding protein
MIPEHISATVDIAGFSQIMMVKGKESMESQNEAPAQRLLLRVPEVAEALGLGRTKVYELIATGELPVIRLGRAVRVSVVALQKWVEEHDKQSLSV